MSGRGTDFFISHAGRDTGWAEWLAWQLQQAGYRVELDVWDWAPGEDFVARMSAALERADRLLAVCTEAYFASGFGGAELRAAFAGSAAAQGQIVPVLVEPVTLPPRYASLIHLDLTGLDEGAAVARLQARLAGGRPTSAPPFPRPGPAPADKPGFAGVLQLPGQPLRPRGVPAGVADEELGLPTAHAPVLHPSPAVGDTWRCRLQEPPYQACTPTSPDITRAAVHGGLSPGHIRGVRHPPWMCCFRRRQARSVRRRSAGYGLIRTASLYRLL